MDNNTKRLAVIVVVLIFIGMMVYAVSPIFKTSLEGYVNRGYFSDNVDFSNIDYSQMGSDVCFDAWYIHAECASYESSAPYNGKYWEVMFSLSSHSVWYFSGDSVGQTPSSVNIAPEYFVDLAISSLPLKSSVSPIADAGGIYYGYVDEVLIFDGSGSYDPDGEIVSWYWNFGDINTMRDDNGNGGDYRSGEIVSYSYPVANLENHYYMVTLTVTDNEGNTGIDYTKSYISPPQDNVNPIADFSFAPNAPLMDKIVTFDGSGSYDPDGTIVGWVWNFGDGHWIAGPDKSTICHAYVSGGSYTVTLEVTDNVGGTDSISKVVGVAMEYELIVNVGTGGNVVVSPFSSDSMYTENMEVALTATASSGYVFDHWSGDATGSANPTTVIMDSDKTVTAYFTDEQPNQYSLTVQSSPTKGGGVILTPTGGTYDADTIVTLMANPSVGYNFDKWGGDASGNSLTTTIIMDGDKTVTAYFISDTARPSWGAIAGILGIIGLASIGAVIVFKKEKQ